MLCAVGRHCSLNIVRRGGQALAAETAGTVGRHQHVVFDAYAAEVEVALLQGRIVYERAAFLLLELYQVRDEIDAGLVGYHVAGDQPARHP